MDFYDERKVFGLESAAFSPEAVALATRRSNSALIEMVRSRPSVSSGEPASIRAAEHGGNSPFVGRGKSSKAETRYISRAGGDKLPLRIFQSSECHGIYLHFHGGGWVLGGATMQDLQLQQLADCAGVVVVSVEYRLAPENPYPAAPDDCETAALWLVRCAQSEFGTSAIIAGGESSGAHLALVTALRLRDKYGLSAFKALNLVSGMYDLRLTPGARSSRPNADLTPDEIRWFVNHYVKAENCAVPDVSPLFAQLSDLSPTLITVGTLDILSDDSLFLYARLLAAGNEAQIAVWPGGLHAFASVPSELASRTQLHQANFLRAKLGAGDLVIQARSGPLDAETKQVQEHHF